ncbi:hypothetical protein Aduo_011538 [Ancylostoma duodenale]
MPPWPQSPAGTALLFTRSARTIRSTSISGSPSAPSSRKRTHLRSTDRAPIKRHASTLATMPQSDSLPYSTPDNFWHPRIALHPWAHLVRPRPLRRDLITPAQISNQLPLELYKQLPNVGYLSLRFVRSLFPRMPPNARIIRAPIPFMELPNLEDAIAFRRDSQLVIQRTLAHMVDPVPQNRTMAPKNVRSSVLYPPTPQGKHPVLYQVAAIHSNHFVLEAKDFLVFQPDRLEVHCIMLDQFSFNIENNTYGYDGTLVFMKDFVWVYDPRSRPSKSLWLASSVLVFREPSPWTPTPNTSSGQHDSLSSPRRFGPSATSAPYLNHP